MSEPVIALNKLTKSYGKHRGIEEISFTVERGEIFGFIGPNGAGKSTTIRTLMGLLKPTGGTASVFGQQKESRHRFGPAALPQVTDHGRAYQRS